MSSHAIEIVEVGPIRPHPNAERLELTNVWGWQVCVGKGDFKEGYRAIYVPPDFVVCVDREPFRFLKHKPGQSHERIRVRRLRGELSQGLLVSPTYGMGDLPLGHDVSGLLGIKRYEPPQPLGTRGMFDKSPSGVYAPKFDVENYQRYPHLLVEGEPVIVTEKIHGANSKFVYAREPHATWRMFVGSRNHWMKDHGKSVYWKAFKDCPSIEKWCIGNPRKILYGEVFGQVQSLKYGAGTNEVFFAAFGVWNQDHWLDWEEFRTSLACYKVPCVPVLWGGPFNEERIKAMSEGPSIWGPANHIREGAVILPLEERNDPEVGRVILKMVSNEYLENH